MLLLYSQADRHLNSDRNSEGEGIDEDNGAIRKKKGGKL